MALINVSITADVIKALDSSVNKTFEDSYASFVEQANWDMLATETSVETERGIYSFVWTNMRLEKLPNGQMIFSNIQRSAVEVLSEDRGQGIEISANDVKDGKTGSLLSSTKAAARAIALAPHDLIVDLIKKGETTGIGYDGVPFFSNSHPIDLGNAAVGSYDNLVTGFALTAANLAAGVAMMQSFLGPDGHVRGMTPNVLVVAPQSSYIANQLTGAQYLDASSNPYLTGLGIKVMVIGDLADEPGSWYLAAADGVSPSGMDPFIYQKREEYSIQSFNPTDTYQLSITNKFAWLIRGRDAAAYGHPFQMIKFKA